VNGNAGDFVLGKLHRVATAHLVHVHTGHGHVQLLCNENQGAGQLLVRMAGPDFRKRQPNSVHVDHSIGGGHLFFRHAVHVRVRTDFAFFLISKPDEYVGMLTGLIFYRLVQGRQKRRAAPVVDDTIACGDVIEMRTNDDDLAGTARQKANDIWQLRPFHGLFGKVLLVATCLRKQLLERISALPVISLVLLQAALDDCASDRLVVDTLPGRVEASERKQGDYRKKPETGPRNLIVHVPRTPPGTEARTCKGLDWCAIVNPFDIWLWEASQS
jgi:hypothetical protein